MTRVRRMRLDTDEAESNRIIGEALNVALMATRLLGFECDVSGHLGPGGNRTSDGCVSDDIIGTAYLRRHQKDEGRIQDQT